MKKRIVCLVLTLVLALGLCAGASAASARSVTDGALSVSGLDGGQYAFAAGYDEAGRFLGARVLTADAPSARAIPGAAEVKVFRTDGQLAPLGEAVSLPGAYQTVRKADGQVALCYEGSGGVRVTTPVTEKVTGKASAFNTKGTLYISGQPYSATALTVEGCDYTVSQAGFQNWSRQPGLPFNDTLDFYLDPWGNICWIELVAEFEYPVVTSLLLSAGVAGTSDGGATVQAELLQPSGAVLTAEVALLDGQSVTDPNAAAEALSAHAPGGFYACQLQRDGTYSLTLTENASDSGWGEALTVPPNTVTAPAADFTGGAVSCVADSETVFVVSRGQPGAETLTRYVGYGDLPAVTVWQGTAVTAEGDGAAVPTARFVYLRTLDEEPARPVVLPEGCVFIRDNSWLIDPELYEDDVYLTYIVDADGTVASMRISAELKDTISRDSMKIGQFAENTYVGKFFSITEQDADGAVSALEPVEAAEVSALGNGVITTAAGTWSYGADTQCVYVDLGWIDDPSMNNAEGVREDIDLYRMDSSGPIGNPDNFFDPGNVSADPDNGAPYRSVKAAVLAPADSTAADYIYIVRELW